MLPVVFVHGLVGSLADARTIAMVRPAVVLCPELLGYGTASEREPGRITIEAQVDHVRAAVDSDIPGARLHLVGHSVGGVIAMAFAHRFPNRVACVINVEGNFTLADAFWSAQLARMTPSEASEMLAGDRADPARWLRSSGVEPADELVRSAAELLDFQPASTIHAMARAVVDFTGRPGYATLLREVFEHTPVHLVAGQRSRSGWDVPGWALAAATSYTEIPEAGHMVMLEAPHEFGQVIATVTASHGDRPG